MDDDLKLEHAVSKPRSSWKGARFWVVAVVIAAGLHLLVFGALALSAHSHKVPAAAPQAQTLPAPAATASVSASSMAAPAPPAPVRPVRPVEHVPHSRLVPTRRPHAAPAPVHKKPEKPIKAKHAPERPTKRAPKHAEKHGKAKPAPALDLNALSHFGSSK